MNLQLFIASKFISFSSFFWEFFFPFLFLEILAAAIW